MDIRRGITFSWALFPSPATVNNGKNPVRKQNWNLHLHGTWQSGWGTIFIQALNGEIVVGIPY